MYYYYLCPVIQHLHQELPQTVSFLIGQFLGIYNPQNEKLHRIKTKSCLAENETSPIKLHPTLAL